MVVAAAAGKIAVSCRNVGSDPRFRHETAIMVRVARARRRLLRVKIAVSCRDVRSDRRFRHETAIMAHGPRLATRGAGRVGVVRRGA
ncbi:hypothetical protein GCM10009679_74680 [Saccharothrix algeriensis]